MRRRALILIVLVVARPLPAPAMTFTAYRIEDKYSIIAASGSIVDGDSARLDRAIKGAPAGRTLLGVRLDSDGGRVLEAEKIAAAIHRAQFAAVVVSGGRCASACFLIFAAAKIRLAAPDALIGVHSVSSGAGEENLSDLGFTTLLARDLAAYNVPEEIIGRLVETEPSKIAWLTGAELASMGAKFIQPHQFEGIEDLPKANAIQTEPAFLLEPIQPSPVPVIANLPSQTTRPPSALDFAAIANGKPMDNVLHIKPIETGLRKIMGEARFLQSTHLVEEGLAHSFELTSDFVFAKSCVPHSCGFDETGWAFDHLGHVWASWTVDGKIIFYGNPPAAVQSALQGYDLSNWRTATGIGLLLAPIVTAHSKLNEAK